MNETAQVWVIDDDKAIRWVLEKALRAEQITVQTFSTAAEALRQLDSEIPNAILTDIRMPGISGLALLDRIHHQHPALPVIVMTAHSDLDSALSAYQGGAFEYLPKPFDVDDATALVRRAISQHQGTRQPNAVTATTVAATEIIGKAPAMQEVFRAIGRLSRSHLTVLITGESGTGKELVARALHNHSPRANLPFVALNTAAIPKDLLESELFGHEKGAFTGAHGQRRGRFEQANGGTLFLDEIGDMPVELQTRLLRVLADGSFYRVGGHTEIRVDVRIITATHQDLEQRVQQGLFREDLYHRLNVIRIHVPALRQRGEDIPLLTGHFMQQAARELDAEPKTLDDDTQRFMNLYSWPGNVRQLENVCRWLMVMSPGQIVHLDQLPAELRSDNRSTQDEIEWEKALQLWIRQRLVRNEHSLLEYALPAFERVMIASALEFTGGRRIEAAKLLGWGRNTLTRKIKELGIGPDDADHDEET
ncbi:MAG: nitrogen regulation protein NR(I) [Gammaproteobacteria bacterium]|nr:nitrogen regulation protein NR(I) [Gammaproteobacteria bacterium]